MRCLKFINCLIILFITINSLHAQSGMTGLFNPVDSVGLYQMNIDVETFHFSGLLLVKRLNDSTIRLVMNSEMGPKLLDMELYPSRYKLHYAFPKVNHKRFLKTLYDDFGTLFQVRIRNKNLSVEHSQNGYSTTYSPGKKTQIIYTADSLSNLFTSGRVMEGTSVSSKFLYVFEEGTSNISFMKLEHLPFTMIISLTRL